MDVDGLGDKLVELLVDEGMVSSMADLYQLQSRRVEKLERMGPRSAENLIAALHKSKQTTLERFLYSLGIREVGEATARSLARHYGNLEALMAVDEEALQKVDDVGPVVAHFIFDFFRQSHNLEAVAGLREAGLTWQDIEVSEADEPLAGETFVITGSFEVIKRSDAKTMLQNLGAKVAGSVSAKTSMVVVGGGATTNAKFVKAQELGIATSDEPGLIELLTRHGAL